MGWWKKRERNKKQTLKRGAELLEDLIECCDGKSNPIKFFVADDIHKATNNFSETNHIYELFDTDYRWFSGQNENHNKILIKKAIFGHEREEDFCRDIAISSMVSGHKNFLKLVGCCVEFEGPVMVYHGVKKHYKLDLKEQLWERRMKISEDIATALAYLHTAFPRPFVYRTFSLENIILDEDGVAKLTAFSSCVSIPEGETFVNVDRITGTYGYMNSNYYTYGKVSVETDVFATGIAMQKLLVGEKRYNELQYDADFCRGRSASWFQFRLLKFNEEGRMDEIADLEMLEKMGDISKQEICQMKAFLILSQRCIGCRGEVPTMMEVAKELKKIQRSLTNDSSYPFVKTQFYSAQDILSYSTESIAFDSFSEIVSRR